MNLTNPVKGERGSGEEMDATKDKGFIWSNETITGRSEQQDLRQETKKSS